MKAALRWITCVSVTVVLSHAVNAQHQSGQSRDQHQGGRTHHDMVNQRGDQSMGFSHTKATHRFRLKAGGGVIEVTANDADDTASRHQIRQHFKQIARKFSEGDFSTPMFIHGQTPPGIETMKRLKAEIKYQYEEIERGALVRISTDNAEAIKAVHEFLRFQIRDHRTGDPVEIEKTPGS